MRPEKTYPSEAALCAAFIEWAKPQGWTAYAETAGWDILLVDPSGRQLGVQAKLCFNATLLRQALPAGGYGETGPDFRAVLLPKTTQDIRDALDSIGLDFYAPSPFGVGRFAPDISDRLLEDWCPGEREKLPAYVPDVRAGASGPVVLTEWKIKALRVCAVLEIDGEIQSKQIKEIGMNPQRWIHPFTGWLSQVHLTRGRYKRGPKLRFDRQHPEVYSQIKAELVAERAAQATNAGQAAEVTS